MKRSKPELQHEWPIEERAIRKLEFANGKLQSQQDTLALETPIALVYNGISYAVMMASPADLEDFALGFSLSEGIIDEPAQFYDCDIHYAAGNPAGLALHIHIAQACFMRLKQRQRNLTGASGCGLCGVDSLANLAPKPLHNASESKLQFDFAAIQRALLHAPEWQVVNQLTGACHAAASFDQQGHIHMLREDIGRHNALDKLIGAHSQHLSHLQSAAVFLTSRASFELVSKAVRMAIPLLVSISAPTSLAADLAQQHGISLCGFARERGLVVYCDPRQLLK